MDRNVGVAAKLSQSDREELAILALARSEPISDLAVQHGVSRKFVYAQKHKARCALDDAFVSAATDDTAAQIAAASAASFFFSFFTNGLTASVAINFTV